MLDTVHEVETPEGVRLSLRAAGPVPRALAFAIDFGLRAGFYFLLLLVLLQPVVDLPGALLLLIVFAGEWLYPVLFEVWNRGQTIGKKAAGLRVVNADGTRVGWAASLLRNLLLTADALPGTYAAGLASMLISPSFQRLGDLAAGTLVVHVGEAPAAAPAPADDEPFPPPLPLTLEEQHAVIAFRERAPLFSQARARELAGLATPLTGDAPDPRARLLGIAAWLLGRPGAERP